MRKKELKLVVTFDSTTSAMHMEVLAKRFHVPGRLIPVPREITAGCGLAYLALPKDREEIEKFMKENHLLPEQTIEIML